MAFRVSFLQRSLSVILGLDVDKAVDYCWAIMAPRKRQSNPKVALRIDLKTVVLIESLEIPVETLASKVRYAMMRGLEVLQAEKAARTK